MNDSEAGESVGEICLWAAGQNTVSGRKSKEEEP